jgi:predicted RNA-binding protein associated with RNAse of E/G family
MAGSSGSAPRLIQYRYLRPPDRTTTFAARLLEITPDHIVLEHELAAGVSVTVGGQEVMAGGYTATWFLFQGQPFDLARVRDGQGRLTGYYADILEPVQWSGIDPASLLPIVDLFLDLWIFPDGSYRVLDEDEFEQAAAAGVVTAGQVAHARGVLRELQNQLGQGVFPPSLVHTFDRHEA